MHGVWAQKKVLHGYGPFNLNLGIFVCFFDVCRESKPFRFNNYVVSMAHFNTRVYICNYNYVLHEMEFASCYKVLRYNKCEYGLIKKKTIIIYLINCNLLKWDF